MTFPTKYVIQLSVLGIAIPIFAAAQSKPWTGLSEGATIPAFSLRDQNGVSRTFADIRGPNGAMLVFYRSADW